MDDKKVFELKRLELAYKRQLLFMLGMILMTLIGIILYIINIYHYQFQLLLVAITLVAIGVIGILNIDSKMKEISKNLKHL
jgi:hypothetical protein